MWKGKSAPRIAIVHDWLYGGGAERVVYELHKLYPDAPIYTSYCSDAWREKLDNKVVTGYLQRWPFSKLRKFLPILRIWWFEHLDLSTYDLVISSSGNGEAIGVKAGKSYKADQTHICYCHSPTHFYWRHYKQYMKQPGFGPFNPLVRVALRILVGPLRKWDYKAAQRPDYLIANSTHIQADIMEYYNRDSTVIFPPVDTERFAANTKDAKTKRSGFVTVSRQVPQKRIDLIVRACTQLNLPLTVIGNGPENSRLRELGGSSVTFITGASDQEVAEYVRFAEAFIFAALDDFGIAPPEALAAGTPVIAYRGGGALDYIKPGITGEFFDAQTVDSLVATLEKFDAKKYDHQQIAHTAQRFSIAQFEQSMQQFVSKHL